MALGAGPQLWGSEEGRGGGLVAKPEMPGVGGEGPGASKAGGTQRSQTGEGDPWVWLWVPQPSASGFSDSVCSSANWSRRVSLTCCSGHPTVPGEPGDTPAFGARPWDPEVSQGKVKSDSMLELFL